MLSKTTPIVNQMTADYTNMIAVSWRHLFQDTPDPAQAFLSQIRFLAGLSQPPKALVLREKDMTEGAYLRLAEEVRDILEASSVSLILHQFTDAARALRVKKIHLPLAQLEALFRETPSFHADFELVGTSVHSVQDALLAEACGADYCFAGNIYETDCKAGLPGRGLAFLRETTSAVHIPVYAIGGISLAKMPEILAAGAAGGCMMSGFMRLNSGQGNTN